MDALDNDGAEASSRKQLKVTYKKSILVTEDKVLEILYIDSDFDTNDVIDKD